MTPNSWGICPSFIWMYASMTLFNVFKFSSEVDNFSLRLITSFFNWELSAEPKFEKLCLALLNLVVDWNATLWRPPSPKQHTRPKWSYPNTLLTQSSAKISLELTLWLISCVIFSYKYKSTHEYWFLLHFIHKL